MSVKDREITEFCLRHNFFNLIYIIIHMKCNQRSFTHKKLHRYTLIDQTGCCKCIMRCTDNHNTLFFCSADHLRRNFRILAYNNTARVNIDRALLCFITVSKDYQIIPFDKLLHQIRIRCSDRYFSFGKMSMFISRK